VSFYGYELAGNTTANGESFDPDGLTFAHRSLPFDTLVRFEGPGGSVVARCNDRGPFVADREFDLSLGAMRAVGGVEAGVVEVTWRAA
jgi:rare lipoprotein A